jgi:hypothetical protein
MDPGLFFVFARQVCLTGNLAGKIYSSRSGASQRPLPRGPLSPAFPVPNVPSLQRSDGCANLATCRSIVERPSITAAYTRD